MSITSVGTGEKSGDVRLVSFKSGFGVKPLLKKVKAMANIDGKDKGGSKKDIYVVGGERAERSGAGEGCDKSEEGERPRGAKAAPHPSNPPSARTQRKGGGGGGLPPSTTTTQVIFTPQKSLIRS